MALAIGLALRALHFVIPGRTETTSSATSSLSWARRLVAAGRTARNPTWLPWAVALGVLTHIAGDALTTAGDPAAGALAAPADRLAFSPMRTGTIIEKAVLVPLFLVATVGFIYLNTDVRDTFDPIVDRFVSSG